MGEKWSEIPGVDPEYEVSNKGRVRKIDWIGNWEEAPQYVVGGGKRGDPRGYLISWVKEGGKRKSRLVHRLVAEAFLAKEGEDLQVNHKNLDKQDNRVENLEWVSARDNKIHAILNGVGSTHKGRGGYKGVEKRKFGEGTPPGMNAGENSGRCKISEVKAREIRDTYDPRKGTQKEWAKRHGVSYSSFQKIIYGIRWKHING